MKMASLNEELKKAIPNRPFKESPAKVFPATHNALVADLIRMIPQDDRSAVLGLFCHHCGFEFTDEWPVCHCENDA